MPVVSKMPANTYLISAEEQQSLCEQQLGLDLRVADGDIGSGMVLCIVGHQCRRLLVAESTLMYSSDLCTGTHHKHNTNNIRRSGVSAGKGQPWRRRSHTTISTTPTISGAVASQQAKGNHGGDDPTQL